MDQNGFDVSMVSADGPELDKVKKNEGVPHYIIPLTRKLTPIQDLYALVKMVMLFRKKKPHLVHTHTPKAGLIGMLAAYIARVPLRIHTIAGLPIMTAKGAQATILRFTEKLTSAVSTEIWPNSLSIKKYMIENKLASQNKLNIIGEGSSNGIDLSHFDTDRERPFSADLNQKLSIIPKDDKIILFIGRIVSSKGIIELIEGFQALHSSQPNTTLVLAGSYETVRTSEDVPIHIKETISSHPKILHLGWVDEVPRLLNFADVLVHPSHREGFPNVILQALASNCCVVCANIPGNIDAVKFGKYAHLTQVGNAKSIETALSKAFTEIENQNFDGKEARMWVESNFDRPIIHKTMRNEYLRLLVEKGLSPQVEKTPI